MLNHGDEDVLHGGFDRFDERNRDAGPIERRMHFPNGAGGVRGSNVQPTAEDLKRKKTFLEDNSQFPRKVRIG